MSQSLELARKLLNTEVEVTVDRQLGTFHPKWNFKYDVNYGYVQGIIAPDGEELDAYLLKVDVPVERFFGQVIAIIHRLKDDDDKLIVVPTNENITDQEIEESVKFQEIFFEHEIIR